MVGEAALLEEFGIRAATVIASKEGCVFWELKKEHFKEIIWKFPTQKEIFDQLVILRAEKTRTKIGDLKAKRARELAKTRNQNRTPDGKIKVRLRERDRQKMDFKHAKEHAVEDTQIFRLAQREATDLTASTPSPGG